MIGGPSGCGRTGGGTEPWESERNPMNVYMVYLVYLVYLVYPYPVYTVYMVYMVDMVYMVYVVYTVDMVYLVYMVYMVYMLYISLSLLYWYSEFSDETRMNLHKLSRSFDRFDVTVDRLQYSTVRSSADAVT